ncbi:tRNA (cytosine-5-)-methyltransferase [Nymphon striatum]|nr:tRNA (cytosine-5-)-methyltransferase [Nymphon striatum]
MAVLIKNGIIEQLSRGGTLDDAMLTYGRLETKPSYIFVENVKGFEDSEARKLLIETLHSCNFHYQEFLISPRNFGIPNSRLRYYLMAKKAEKDFCFNFNGLCETIEELKPCSACRNLIISKKNLPPSPISSYLEHLSDSHLLSLNVPDQMLLRYSKVMDIVTPDSKKSCCFTKGYGRCAEGSGSVLQQDSSVKIDEVFHSLNSTVDVAEQIKILKSLKLRFFSPREIANLMCFPAEFGFPSELNQKQLFKVLGNSVNVRVISILFSIMFCSNKNI